MKNRTSGFTLVELMVVALLVGLVVLVSTQIPLFTFSSWRKGTDRLRMQRDAHLVMIKIQRELRPANLSNIDVPNSYTLIIDQNTGEKFFLQEDKLFYQNPEGTQKLVIEDIEDDTVTQFAAEKILNVTGTDGVINITLTLVKEKVGTVMLKTAVKPRN